MRTAFQVPLLLVMLIGPFCAGCSTFRGDSDADRAYEQSRRYVENGDVNTVGYDQEQGPREGLGIGDLNPANAGTTIKKLTGRGPKRRAAEQAYQEGQQIYRSGAALRERGQPHTDAFVAAAEKYTEAAKRWPDSSLEEDAMFHCGECYFFADHYDDSNETFQELLEKHPNTDYLDRVEAMRFRIAEYWLHLDKQNPQAFYEYNLTDERRPMRALFSSAVGIFDRIRMDDPTGKLADDATLAAGNAHFDQGNYIEAAGFYDDLRQTFPSSEHQYHAHYFGLQSKLRMYPGKNYDGKLLDESEELLKTIRKQFPRHAEKERDYLAKAHAEIRFRKAERDWKNASYYDKRGENRSAKYYYNTLVREYSDTPFAQRARERIIELGGEPDEPTQYLGWLVNLFPEDKEAKPLIATGDGPTLR